MIAFVGCRGEDRSAEPPASRLLDFSTYVAQTKGITKKEFVMGDQFFVCGVTTLSKDYNPAAPNADEFIFSMETAKGVPVMNFGQDKENRDIWKYNNPIVWSDGKSTFFAFSPVPNHADNFGITNYNRGFALNELPSLHFTVAGGYDPLTASPDDIAASVALNSKQVDLITAYAPNQTVGKSVNLTFNHALAQLSFAIRPTHSTGFIRINALSLHNVATAAKLSLAAVGDPQAPDYTAGWLQSSLSDHKSFAVNLRHDVASLIPAKPDKIYELNDADQTLMMIPQSLQNITVAVNYSYSADGISWPISQADQELAIALNTISSHWQSDQQYRYVLNISPANGTAFDAEILP